MFDVEHLDMKSVHGSLNACVYEEEKEVKQEEEEDKEKEKGQQRRRQEKCGGTHTQTVQYNIYISQESI